MNVGNSMEDIVSFIRVFFLFYDILYLQKKQKKTYPFAVFSDGKM